MLASQRMLDPDLIAPLRIRPLKRSEYDRLVALGVFEDERIELLCGHLVEMSPQGAPHAAITAMLGEKLTLALAGRATVRQHCPLAVSDDSEPEPDVAVVPPGDYREDHPTTAHLVVEIAGSSLKKDRTIKALLYAAAGIPEYWVVDLASSLVEVHTEPSPDGYRTVRTLARDAEIALTEFPDVRLQVAEVVPAE